MSEMLSCLGLDQVLLNREDAEFIVQYLTTFSIEQVIPNLARKKRNCYKMARIIFFAVEVGVQGHYAIRRYVASARAYERIWPV